MIKKTIPVVGMVCAAYSAHVERKLNSLPGIQSTSVSLSGRSALVESDEREISLEQMKREINAIGYDLVIESDQSVEEIEHNAYRQPKRKTLLSWLFAVLCTTISMRWISLGVVQVSSQMAMLLALANFVYYGCRFFVSAWKQLLQKSANMDTLVAFSTGIALASSALNTFYGERVWGGRGIEWHAYFDASVMIITFVLTGRLLEEGVKDSTAGNVRQLMGLSPKTAHLVSSEQMKDIPLSTVKIGGVLEVRTGEKVPVDGEVTWATSFTLEGGAYIDESTITGEPTPALKLVGVSVLVGTVISQGKLRFKAQQIGEHTALAQIIQMVQQAQGSRAPVQRMVDKLALVFVPAVMGVAVLTLAIWWFLGGSEALPQAILSAVPMLVIACPCTMSLATPTALMVGIGKAAEKNMLIKDATALESLCKVNAMVIDKTGTLTILNQQIDFTKADNLPLEVRKTLKSNACEAMLELQNEAGVEVYMTSGDKGEAANYQAQQAGIRHYRSKVLPQDKEDLVRRLQCEGKQVAMVGDSINDAQALAMVDVSIAMGRGTDMAMDVTQVTMVGDDFRRLPQAIHLSRKTVPVIRQNLFWAFIYNIVCIPLAADVLYLFGFNFQITPVWASVLMTFSSVSVVLNSLRLKYMEQLKGADKWEKRRGCWWLTLPSCLPLYRLVGWVNVDFRLPLRHGIVVLIEVAAVLSGRPASLYR